MYIQTNDTLNYVYTHNLYVNSNLQAILSDHLRSESKFRSLYNER